VKETTVIAATNNRKPPSRLAAYQIVWFENILAVRKPLERLGGTRSTASGISIAMNTKPASPHSNAIGSHVPANHRGGASVKKLMRSYASNQETGLRIVAMRGLIDINGFHVGKVDRDRSFVSSCHYLECLYHMLEPPIDFLVLLRRGG
jgi:hypothetical protein